MHIFGDFLFYFDWNLVSKVRLIQLKCRVDESFSNINKTDQYEN